MISFQCNICGTNIERETVPFEEPSCSDCGSNARMRAVIHMLSMEVFGESRTLPDFPRLENIRGFGMSDDLSYALPLAAKFGYVNTFYDRDPYLDIVEPHPALYGTYDFILSSDVFEHIAIPVDRAFAECFRLLKPDGVLITTVPSSLDEETVEHFPDLHKYAVVDLGGKHVLVNRRVADEIDIRTDLVFHGGPGATLEMRLFSRKDLERKLCAAGFSQVSFMDRDAPEHGIFQETPWGHPFVARKAPRTPVRLADIPVAVEPATVQQEAECQQEADADGPSLRNLDPLQQQQILDLQDRLQTAEWQIDQAANSRWVRLGRALGLGPKFQR